MGSSSTSTAFALPFPLGSFEGLSSAWGEVSVFMGSSSTSMAFALPFPLGSFEGRSVWVLLRKRVRTTCMGSRHDGTYSLS